LEIALPVVDDSEIVVEIRVVGIDFESGFEVCVCLVVVLAVKFGYSKLAVSFGGVKRSQFRDRTLSALIADDDDVFEAPDGLVVIALVEIPDSLLVPFAGGAAEQPIPKRQAYLQP
jgi:hypothetical protein